MDGAFSGLGVGILLAPQALDIDHLAAAADLTQRLAPAVGFGILNIELLQLALQPKRRPLGLESQSSAKRALTGPI